MTDRAKGLLFFASIITLAYGMAAWDLRDGDVLGALTFVALGSALVPLVLIAAFGSRPKP